MRVVLDLTPSEYRAAHDLMAYALRRARPDDPDTASLRSFFDKYRASNGKALCEKCRVRIVYARGKCEPCYRASLTRAAR